MRRANVVKLVVDKETHERLRELAIATAKCWNEVNWLRMQQFKEGRRIDFNRTEKEVYEKYKHVLKVNAEQVARKNAEAWRDFFSLVKEKKEGKLPKWLRPRPPGYWKGEDGKYKLMIIIGTTATRWTRTGGSFTSRTSSWPWGLRGGLSGVGSRAGWR
jgi:putative transposase